jgi:hypothetical protein
MATVPGCAPEEQEKFYAAMARGCDVHVPGTGQRLYAISPRHDVGGVGEPIDPFALTSLGTEPSCHRPARGPRS